MERLNETSWAALIALVSTVGIVWTAPDALADDVALTPALSSARPWMNPALQPDARARLLEERMTIDEKIALLHSQMAMPIGPFGMPKDAIGSAGFVPATNGSAPPHFRKATPAWA